MLQCFIGRVVTYHMSYQCSSQKILIQQRTLLNPFINYNYLILLLIIDNQVGSSLYHFIRVQRDCNNQTLHEWKRVFCFEQFWLYVLKCPSCILKRLFCIRSTSILHLSYIRSASVMHPFLKHSLFVHLVFSICFAFTLNGNGMGSFLRLLL